MRKILFAIFSMVFLFSMVSLYNIYTEYKEGEDSYSEISNVTQLETPETIEEVEVLQPSVDEIIEEDKETIKYQIVPLATMQVNWEELPDTVCGWIKVEGQEVIDYPVVQSEDNSYYLNHLYDGTSNKNGSIFVDYRNDGFGNRHVILYGHNMKNGAMFASIKDYQKQEYADEHSLIYIGLPDGTTAVYKVFSCFLTSADGEEDYSAYQVSFDGAEWDEWLTKTTEKSLIDMGIEIPNKCNILTLSTCMSRGDKLERCVVHAVQIKNEKRLVID